VTPASKAPATGRRQRARRGEGDLLRDEILEAAERLLIETGNRDAVSIRAVAEGAGVTPPSIYLHFADKTELLFAVCEKHFEVLDRHLEEAAARTDDPLESLRLRGQAYVRFGLDHPEHYRILFMGKPDDTPDYFGDERLRQSASFDHLVAGVQRCLDAGVLTGDPTLIAFGLWSVVHGVTSLLIAKPDFPWPPVEQLVDHVLNVQMEGLLG
jgi:AcrR family transcriptional regulator